MKHGIINSRWIGLDPRRRIDARFWLKVIAHLRAEGLDPNSASDEAVSAAIAKVGHYPKPRKRRSPKGAR